MNKVGDVLMSSRNDEDHHYHCFCTRIFRTDWEPENDCADSVLLLC